MKKILFCFEKHEILLWIVSVLLIVLSFFLFSADSFLTLTASVIGVTSLLFSAKGHPMGQLLMVIFSLLYGIISLGCAYYGEMITYLGMTMPMAVLALIAWLRHPFQGNRAQVQVNTLPAREHLIIWLAAVPVTVLFYFLLRAFGTANLLPGTLSVTTSFLAVCYSFRRSPYFALAYAANDLILILLWMLAGQTDARYYSVVVCFCAFLVNDLYGFFCWQRMKKRQAEAKEPDCVGF